MADGRARRKRGARVRAAGIAAGAVLALVGCPDVRAGERVAPAPWVRAELPAGRADLDSALSTLDIGPAAGQDSASAALLERCLRGHLRRRGWILGAADSRSRIVASWSGSGAVGTGPGDAPLDAGGHAAALAQRVGRASSRAVAPTRASLTVQLQKFGSTLWTWEASFDPVAGDTLRDVDAAVRAVVWHMPRFVASVPELRRLTPDDVIAFYRDELESRTMFCPVLPYAVRFPDLERAYLRGGRKPGWQDTRNAYDHEAPELFPSYLDLLLHAEAALPRTFLSYVDVAAPELWRDVTLAGAYRDASGEAVHLEIRLRGDTRGYRVDGTRVLDAEEAAAHAAAAREFARRVEASLQSAGR